MDFSFWAQWGLAAVCLAALAGAVWTVVKWFGVNLVKPGYDRALQLVDALEDVLRGILTALHELHQRVERMEQTQREHFQICSRGAGIAPPKG